MFVSVHPNPEPWKRSSAQLGRDAAFHLCFVSPVCASPWHASRFHEFSPEIKRREIRHKMAARPDHSLSWSQGNLTYKDFPSRKHRAGTQSRATSRAGNCRALSQQQQQQQHGCALDMCASVYTWFPLESVTHARGWVRGVACGWVAVNPWSSPG